MEAASKDLRLFFAVPVTDEVRSAAAALPLPPGAKRLAPEAMHVTLRFLGNTPTERVPALERALDAAVRGRSPFSLEFDRLGHFDERVLWAGVGLGAEPLESLAGALASALEAEGFPREDRPFAAHLTLARLSAGRRLGSFAGPLSWSCPVDRVILYSSTLTPRGSVHSVLRERRLGE